MAKWKKSDRPYDSQHIEGGQCSARVKPDRNGYEYTVWQGAPNRRTLYSSGLSKTLRTAKALATKRLATCLRYAVVR